MKSANIAALAASAQSNSDTNFVRFLPAGGKRAKIVVCSVASNFANKPGTFVFGSMKKGKFVEKGESYQNEIASVPKDSGALKKSVKVKSAPAPKKTPVKAKKAEVKPASEIKVKGEAAKLFEGVRRGSGRVAAIDELLYTLSDKKEKGYARSKYTVTEAVQILVKKFPDANPGSLRRVAKVRPRHLERSKTSGVTGKAPRWALVPAGSAGTEYMKRMDALLMAGKMEKKEIAEVLSKEFGRDVSKVLAAIQARTPKLRAKHGKDGVGTKPARALKGEDTKRQATKKKNLALAGATPGAEIDAGTPVSATVEAKAESPV